jgi:hypothetical protein
VQQIDLSSFDRLLFVKVECISMEKRLKTAITASVIYFILFLLSYIYFIMRYEHDKFAGILLVVFTAPWSELLVLGRKELGMESEMSFVASNILLWVSAIINVFIIFLLSQKYLTEQSNDNK